MTEYLSLEDVLGIAAIAIGAVPVVRDIGLLDSACHRPAAQAWGHDAYSDLLSKAAAQLQSLTNNHALVDGNKRAAWLATVVFLRLNGATVTAIDGYDSAAARIVLAVAAGGVRDVATIRAALAEMVSVRVVTSPRMR